MYSVPRSMPRTAEAAEAVDAKMKKSERMSDRLESRRRPWGGIVGWGVDGRRGWRQVHQGVEVVKAAAGKVLAY